MPKAVWVARVFSAWLLVWGVPGCSAPPPTADAHVEDSPTTALQSIGGPCATDADCRAGLECFSGASEARVWPGGYCTRSCRTDDDCGGGARCGQAYRDGTGGVDRCLAPCERIAGERGGCREGYACSYDGACTVGCTTDEQCISRDQDPPAGRAPPSPGASCELSSGRCRTGANPGARHGDACTENSDCSPSAACFDAAGCLNTQCDLGGDRACPASAICYGIPTGWDLRLSLCVPRCVPGVDGRNRDGDACPRDWACNPGDSAVPALESGYCFPFFPHNAATSFGRCDSDDDCANPLGHSFCEQETGFCVARFCAAEAYRDVPELACPAGGVCVTPDPATFDPPLSPSDEQWVRLGSCIAEGAT